MFRNQTLAETWDFQVIHCRRNKLCEGLPAQVRHPLRLLSQSLPWCAHCSSRCRGSYTKAVIYPGTCKVLIVPYSVNLKCLRGEERKEIPRFTLQVKEMTIACPKETCSKGLAALKLVAKLTWFHAASHLMFFSWQLTCLTSVTPWILLMTVCLLPPNWKVLFMGQYIHCNHLLPLSYLFFLLFPFSQREIIVAYCAFPLLHICMYFPDVNPQVHMVVLGGIWNSKKVIHCFLELGPDLKEALRQLWEPLYSGCSCHGRIFWKFL